MPTKNKKTILYDGSCEMCSTIIKKVDASENGDEFKKVDLTTGTIPKNLTRKMLEKEIHVIEANGDIHRNFDAILRILEEYPKWKFLVKIGSVPIIYTICSLGYKVVAVNRHFFYGSISRIFWLKFVVVLGLISGLLLSVQLWHGSDRFYPTVPVIDNVTALPGSLETILFYMLLILLAAVLFVPNPRYLIAIILGLSFMLVISDQSRLQPWFYQYTFMLATLSVFSWNYKDKPQANAVLNICRLLIASIYFWSGLQKVNAGFMLGVYPWLMQPLANVLPESLATIIQLTGIFIPFFEMSIGIALLFPHLRNHAVVLAAGMHLSILAALGPFGHNWNSVIWPWNIAMILMVFLLFWNVKQFSAKELLVKNPFILHKIILILFTILPLLSFANRWDSYPSFTLYSGNTNSAFIAIDHNAETKLPEQIQRHVTYIGTDAYALNIFLWSNNELNVPSYPETRIYKRITAKLCEYTDSSGLTLHVQGKPTWANREQPTTYACADLE